MTTVAAESAFRDCAWNICRSTSPPLAIMKPSAWRRLHHKVRLRSRAVQLAQQLCFTGHSTWLNYSCARVPTWHLPAVAHLVFTATSLVHVFRRYMIFMYHAWPVGVDVCVCASVLRGSCMRVWLRVSAWCTHARACTCACVGVCECV